MFVHIVYNVCAIHPLKKVMKHYVGTKLVPSRKYGNFKNYSNTALYMSYELQFL
jgi:hypothetical protein